MAFRFFQRTTTIAALFSTALAQIPNIIPLDLGAGFNNKEIQVSFSAKAVDGFASGTTFGKDAVATEPTFALGDSNGISPSTRYTLIMVDTTCTGARKLHYARSNFKFSFAGGTNIETGSPPLLDYKAPGALGEQGDDRQYVFLMYTNPQRREFAAMQLPAEGEVFDAKKFQSDNGLKDPVAGVGMVVKLGGTADCGGEDANQVPSGLPTAGLGTSSGIASTTARSSAVSATAPAQTSSPAGSVSVSSSTLSGGDEEQGATRTSAVETPVPEASSTLLQTDDRDPTSAASIATLSSVRATATGSPTTSGGLPEQTANAAPGIPVGHGAFVAQLLVVAGVLIW
ncbi:hypothetical protein BU25DRAFT_274319 [Macroventuria anomochaeta]|uniref:Uncharacterized protein n=1 Tax=Macroventuria anomochaeta TaxID=301207 RepID=A0ACB6S6H0_9PLEO|nr:uncharacterized protein BU25DRAFT_274319 [Macroventuria anomochaeta]KAF2629791.1 hypothetical protein BU25DRAFT_274319 [Macroventuria anomochaeta]